MLYTNNTHKSDQRQPLTPNIYFSNAFNNKECESMLSATCELSVPVLPLTPAAFPVEPSLNPFLNSETIE